MKIDTQSAPLPHQSVPFKHERNTDFEHWLGTSENATKSHDYYWQHQHQLQQSDLTFNPVTRQTKPVVADDIPPLNHPAVTEPLISTNRDTTAPSHRQNILTPAYDEFLSSLISAIEKPQTTVEKNRTPSINHAPSTMTNAAIVKNTRQPAPVNNPIDQAITIFKNYQLFVDNKAIELTLNTTQLSKQEVIDLQKHIKQWLIHKGYTLKQLIINGVPQ